MDTEDKKMTLPERLAKLEEELKENQGFLQTYMLSPSPDFRPAEEERIREISRLADEMMGMLDELIQANENSADEEGMDEDLNLEYKTHTLGDPDGEDNIEGDWNIDEEEMIPISEAESLPEAEELLSKKEKKGKKGKKGKKAKKSKKGKKSKKD